MALGLLPYCGLIIGKVGLAASIVASYVVILLISDNDNSGCLTRVVLCPGVIDEPSLSFP